MKSRESFRQRFQLEERVSKFYLSLSSWNAPRDGDGGDENGAVVDNDNDDDDDDDEVFPFPSLSFYGF